MSSAASVEVIEQQLVAIAEHAGAANRHRVKRDALGYARWQFGQFPNYSTALQIQLIERRLKAAHRALFRVVE